LSLLLSLDLLLFLPSLGLVPGPPLAVRRISHGPTPLLALPLGLLARLPLALSLLLHAWERATDSWMSEESPSPSPIEKDRARGAPRGYLRSNHSWGLCAGFSVKFTASQGAGIEKGVRGWGGEGRIDSGRLQ
jgi:hypothetical protein